MMKRLLWALPAFCALAAAAEQVKTISADLVRANPPFVVTTAARTTPLIRAMIEQDRVPYRGVTNWSAVFFYASSPSSMLGMAVTNVATGRTWFDFRLNADQTAVPGRYFSQLILYGPATQEWVRGAFTIEPSAGTGPFDPLPWNATNVYNAMEVDGLFEAFSNRLAGVAWTGESDPVFGASPASGISTSQLAQWDAAFSWGDHAGAALGGDATGTLGNVNIVALRGAPIAPIAPTDGQALVWRDDLSAYVPGVVSGGGGGDIAVGPDGVVTAPETLIMAMGGTGTVSTVSGIGTNRVGLWRKRLPAGNAAMSLAVDGSEIGYFSSNGLALYRGTLELFEDFLNVNVRAYDGSAAQPALAFAGGPGRGWWYRPMGGDRVWSYSQNGTNILWLDAFGLHIETNRWLDAAIRPHHGTAAAPALSYPVSTGRAGWYRFEGPNDWAWGYAHGTAGLRLWIDQHGLHLTNGAAVFGIPLGGGTITNETDPVFTTSIAARVTATATQRWEQAHAWGNHAVAGYLTNAPAYAPNAGTSAYAAVAGQVTSTVAKAAAAYRILDPTAETVWLEVSNYWPWIKGQAGDFRLPSTNDLRGMVTNGQPQVTFDAITAKWLLYGGYGIDNVSGCYTSPESDYYFSDIGKWAGMTLDIRAENEDDWLVLYKEPGVSELRAESLQVTLTNQSLTAYNALRLGGIDAARFTTNAGAAGTNTYWAMRGGQWEVLPEIASNVHAQTATYAATAGTSAWASAANSLTANGKADIVSHLGAQGMTWGPAHTWFLPIGVTPVMNFYDNYGTANLTFYFDASTWYDAHVAFPKRSGTLAVVEDIDHAGATVSNALRLGGIDAARFATNAGTSGTDRFVMSNGVWATLSPNVHWTNVTGLGSAATSTVAGIRSGLLATNAAWTAATQQWTTAYAWGDHAEAGYQKVGTSVFARVSVADQSRLGANMVTNSGFNSSAAGWILGGGASWVDSRIYCPFGQESTLAPSNALPLQTGRFYRVQFDLFTANSSEFVTLRMGGQTNTWTAGPNRSVDALVWTRTSSNLHLSVMANAASVYVDNVAVYPVAEGDIRAAGSVWAADNIYLGGRSITNLAAEWDAATFAESKAYTDQRMLEVTGTVEMARLEGLIETNAAWIGLHATTGVHAYAMTAGTSAWAQAAFELDPVFTQHVASAITGSQITNWTTAYQWGNHAAAGYLVTNTWDWVSNTVTENASQGNIAYSWGNHAEAGYATGTPVMVESDPAFTSSIAALITPLATQRWEQAHAWGNHATNGYLVTNTWDGVSNTVTENASQGNIAYSWGNHATNGYLKSYSETDPLWGAVSNSVVINAQQGAAAFAWGNHAEAGYATGTSVVVETDPVFTNSIAAQITGSNTQRWNEAHSWGDHSTNGYVLVSGAEWAAVTNQLANHQFILNRHGLYDFGNPGLTFTTTIKDAAGNTKFASFNWGRLTHFYDPP